MSLARQIYEQVMTLPEPLAREVFDFVAFLCQRAERGETQPLIPAQSSSLAEIWDSDADDIWDQVATGLHRANPIPVQRSFPR